MYHKQRQIKKLNSYIPAAEAFRVFSGEKDCVFLDSSLVNDLGRYSIIGAEAVVRWQRPDGTVMIPDAFISLYERNGRIIDLDFFVFEEVVKFLAQNKKKG